MVPRETETRSMSASPLPGLGLARTVILGLALVGLAACASDPGGLPTGQPSFYRNRAQPGAELDATAAASMLSGYRANNGLPPVTVDSALMTLAEQQARAMVARDRLSHEAGGPFTARLRR